MYTKPQIIRRLKKIPALVRRIGLRNRDYSIISNNCWGGVLYDYYALPYQSPTIGLWFPPDDFVRFCGNLHFYLECELIQVNWNDSRIRDLLIKKHQSGNKIYNDLNDLIIGRLDDVEIVFLHYHSFEDAKTKWEKRKNRIRNNNIMFKMNDQNGCTEQNAMDFLNLNVENKLFITADEKFQSCPNVLYLEKYKNEGYVVDDTRLTQKELNKTKLLNEMVRK